ncbi:TPA: ferredoxin, partial [Neisseria meningitidis]
QIAEARERAELRRAQRDMKYGSDSEKAAALEYLKQYKAKQEAAQNTAS